MTTRTVLHHKRIEAVAFDPRVHRELNEPASKIVDDVRGQVSGSSTLRPMGSRTVRELTERGVRVGTSWGPAVPVEYGTARTPARRIWLSAAEKVGRVEFR